MHYSARLRFLEALNVVAQGLDAQGGNRHSRALAAALTALDEADDFVPAAGTSAVHLDVARRIASHRTPVLVENREVTAAKALESYFTYAQEQFATATGDSVAGSTALSALGKLYSTMADEPAPLVRNGRVKARVLQQAALTSRPDNWAAANELAVLLARDRRWNDARAWLQHSLDVYPTSEAWSNLAVVHHSLGDASSAQRCRGEAAALAQQLQRGPGGAGRYPVQWISPEAARPGRQNDAPSARQAGGQRLPGADSHRHKTTRG